MKISYSIVLFNNKLKPVLNLYENIRDTVPRNVDYEIYFINNSIDNSELNELVTNITYQDHNVKLITPEKNLGFGAGNNLAIEQINSDFHIVLNADIEIPNVAQMEKMIVFMENTQCVMMSPLIRFPNGDIQKLVKRTPTVFDMLIRFLGPHCFKARQEWFTYSPHGYEKKHLGNNFPGSFLVFKTSTLKQIHGFDEKYFLYMEDSDISRTMASKGEAFFFPDAYVYHEWQRNNKKSIKGMIQMLRSMFIYFNKWGWKFL